MRMKEDHMRNGQLKPACNVQSLLKRNTSLVSTFALNAAMFEHLSPHIIAYKMTV